MEVMSRFEGLFAKIENKADVLGALIALAQGYANSNPVRSGAGFSGFFKQIFTTEIPRLIGVHEVPMEYWGQKGPLAYVLWKLFSGPPLGPADGSSWTMPFIGGLAASIGARFAKEIGVHELHPLINKLINLIEKAGAGSAVAGLIGALFLPGSSPTSASTTATTATATRSSYIYR